MLLNTSSATISFARKLEEDSARFYEGMAKSYTQEAVFFQLLATENKRNITQVERAYYGVISDALEGCFAFNMDTEKFEFPASFPGNTDYAEALGMAIRMEEKIIDFYTQAAEQSKSLMADVPRAFSAVARKRGNRIASLKELQQRSA